MQSKEEIEKALNNLWNSLDDELFNLLYSQEEMQEDLRTVLNEYNYLDVMNDRKEQKIQHLELRKQKLIEKLEEQANRKIPIEDADYVQGYRDLARDLLEILKGENEKQWI